MVVSFCLLVEISIEKDVVLGVIHKMLLTILSTQRRIENSAYFVQYVAVDNHIIPLTCKFAWLTLSIHGTIRR